MSQRNSPAAKRQRAIRRSLAKGRLPTSINLIEWVKIRAHISTGRAVKVIMARSLMVDSHVIGVGQDKFGSYLKPVVPAELRGKIVVVEPKSLKEARESEPS